MKIAMIILAAGFSRRMGVLKPLLPVGKQPAILRCISAAEHAGISDIIAVTGHNKDLICDILRTYAPSARIAHNDRYRDGMFSSVCTGVVNLPRDIDGFFLLPADCCAVSADALKTLIGEFEKAGREFVTRPKFQGKRGHPPLIPAQFVPQLITYSGEDGLKGILRQLPTLEIEMPDCFALLDMDTPEDYAVLLEHLGLPAYPDSAQCAELFSECNTPDDIVRHGQHVAETALKIAGLINLKQPLTINTELLNSACLLHDIKRAEPEHAMRGMEFLLKKGYPRAAILVGEHMDLSAPPTGIGESELLYLADKLCRRGNLVRLDETLREIEARFASDSDALISAKTRIENAMVILELLKRQYGIGYSDIFS